MGNAGSTRLESLAFAPLFPLTCGFRTAMGRDSPLPVLHIGSVCQAMVHVTNLSIMLKYELC